MRVRSRWLYTALATFGLLTGAAAPASAVAHLDASAAVTATRSDDLPSPLADWQRRDRALALQQVLTGKTSADGPDQVVELGPNHYASLSPAGTGAVWTVLAQFGDAVSPTYGGSPGPAHNEIPEPDRRQDNVRTWKPDFDSGHYADLLFSDDADTPSLRSYLAAQSADRYTVQGRVTDWVTVPNNEAYYGSNYCGQTICARSWLFIQDAVNAWYQGQLSSGRTKGQIRSELAELDVRDRYDYDHDGDYNEPDGYIDHFQAVHAGSGEEAGGGAQGTDAITSHHWYAFYNDAGQAGPDFNRAGGIRIGDTDLWLGDYSVAPEDAALGTFAHQLGHDLGLPELGDSSDAGAGSDGTAEPQNSTGFWSLMSAGAQGSTGKPAAGIGGRPAPMSAYEKLSLGWSDATVVDRATTTKVRLAAAASDSEGTKQLVVALPDKQVDTQVGAAASGRTFYHSGSGNGLDHTMTRTVTLPSGSVGLAAKARYDLEDGFDHALLTVNGDPVSTSLSQSDGPGPAGAITGSSGGAWVDLTADLSAWAGQRVTLGLRYVTDASVATVGFGIDDIAITGLPLDDAESDPGWSYDGFSRTEGTVSGSFFNAYVAEYRTYEGPDKSLRTSPYVVASAGRPDLVEHFRYEPGLLIWYLDGSFADNDVADHCAAGSCGGRLLPVDAHPDLLVAADGSLWAPPVQTYDSAFGLDRTARITLHREGVAGKYGGLPANRVFDDTMSYWRAPDPQTSNRGWSGVAVPRTGTTIRVDSVSKDGRSMKVTVKPK